MNGMRFSIMGGIGLATVLGIFKPAPGRTIPANVETNRLLMEVLRWSASAGGSSVNYAEDHVLSENERLRVETLLTVRAGTQELVETGSR